MTTSANRTITITSSGQRGLAWPVAQPTDDLDYSVAITSLLTEGGDSIDTVTLECKPSGIGEMEPLVLSVDGGVVTAELAGGVAGRFYVCHFTIVTLGDRTFEFFVQLAISSATATYPRTAPPSEDYGDPLTATGSDGGPIPPGALTDVADGLVAVGTNQSTALLLSARVNIVESAPSGTGVRLPSITSGEVVVINFTANSLPVYPVSGAKIDDGSINAAGTIYAHGTATYATDAGDDQWWSR